MTIQKLNSLPSDVPAGAIPASIRDELLQLVVASWHEFSGSDETSMGAWKISRDEGPKEIIWSPPSLSFAIERHGGTALGSTRAESQQWTLNLERRTADRFRQLAPSAPKVNVKLLADDVCNAVQAGPNSASRLVSDGIVVWESDNELTVDHGEIVGGDFRQTREGRRKRFRAKLKMKMELIGWELVSQLRRLKFRKMK
jgi:hypothetical protein